MHSFGVKEEFRSQLVCSFLISLNNGLEDYNDLKTNESLNIIKHVLNKKIDNDSNNNGQSDEQKKKKIKMIIEILGKKILRIFQDKI